MKPNLKTAIATLLIIGSVAFLSLGNAPKSTSTANDPVAMVSNGALLLDVRTPGEFGNGHIQGAVNIPVDQLQARLAELGAKDKSIVVYCQSGGRSAAAKSLLDRAGFTTVYDLGPMSAWPQKR